MIPPSILSLVLFMSVVVFCIGFGIWATARTAPAGRSGREGGRALAVLVAWWAATSAPAGFGWTTVEHPFPWMPIMVVLFAVFAFSVAFSPFGKRLASGVPLAALIGFQGIRLPIEIVLHWWAEEGVAPPQMTWTGENIDILAGVISLLAIPFVHHRSVAWGVSLVSFALLMNVGRVVALSLPTPLRGFETVLTLPFHLPTAWIASICVTAALTVHLLTFRRLLSADATGPADV